jgi:hypothetical protein
MSHTGPDDQAEAHRQAAAATEHHAKSEHHHPEHKSSGGGAYDTATGHGADASESSFFVRHRSKLAAGLMIVLALIFFTFVFGFIRF